MAKTTSRAPRRAYVWAWLPGQTEHVLAGRIEAITTQPVMGASRERYRFRYSKTYMERTDAISLFLPELPLGPDSIDPPDDMMMAGCLRDGSPDSWGQRVIIDRLTGKRGPEASEVILDELTYLLESGSNRIGGLDFQFSSTEYVPRVTTASLDELHEAANALQDGKLTLDLEIALAAGTAVGGARPKVLVADGDTEYIAKFSTSSDTYPQVKAEAAGLELARRVGIAVPSSRITTSLNRDVLLITRFDRPGGRTRRMTISALTMLGFGDFLGARWSSYPEILDVLRRFSASGAGLGAELFERIVLNILIGNTDDHARNHAAFWDGKNLELTPAYDLCPQLRTGREANQAMDIGRASDTQSIGDRRSTRSTCMAAASVYGLTPARAAEIFDRQVQIITESWDDVADAVRLTTREADAMWKRQILNPYALT